MKNNYIIKNLSIADYNALSAPVYDYNNNHAYTSYLKKDSIKSTVKFNAKQLIVHEFDNTQITYVSKIK